VGQANTAFWEPKENRPQKPRIPRDLIPRDSSQNWNDPFGPTHLESTISGFLAKKKPLIWTNAFYWTFGWAQILPGRASRARTSKIGT